MKRGRGYFALALMIGGVAMMPAAEAADAPLPSHSARTVPGPDSPVVHADGTITFYVLEPNAGSVSLDGDHPIGDGYNQGKQLTPMVKDDRGVWAVTVGPLKSEIYSYYFLVDGLRTLDPHNILVTRDGSRYANWVLVPGAQASIYQINDVPHGLVQQVWYSSPTLKSTRRMTVYTPPGYDSNQRRYPVLYLQHGGGGDEEIWADMGRAPEIFDNLIAQGTMVPMIVMMGNGNSSQVAAPNRVPPLTSVDPTITQRGSVPYAESIVHDIVPYIDAHYRTKADADDRAIAGLSMGGGQTLYAGLRYPDVFHWVGIFSGGLPTLPGVAIRGQMPADAAQRRGPDVGNTIDLAKFEQLIPLNPSLNTKLRLFYIALGQDDGLVESWNDARKLYDQRGIKYTFVSLPGYGHEWPFWRINLQDFSSRLFKAGRTP